MPGPPLRAVTQLRDGAGVDAVAAHIGQIRAASLSNPGETVFHADESVLLALLEQLIALCQQHGH
jgi:hypothetical protein